MQIIYEEKEKECLGVDTVSIRIENNDTYEEAKNVLEDTYAQYLVLKVPSLRNDITSLASAFGYTFVEDMMLMEHDLHDISRTPLQQRLYDSVNVSKMSDIDFDILYKEVENGLFSSDRISMDPFFGKEIGSRRYVIWLKDELSKGAEFYKGSIKGEMTGFFTLREIKEGIYTSTLGGVFEKWRKGGLGTNIQAPDIVKKKGGKRLELSVSTNNMVQIRALIQNGFFPRSCNHVFIKHC